MWKLCICFRLRGGSYILFYAATLFGWIEALASVFSPCLSYTPSQQLANCFQINLPAVLVFSAPQRNSPCLVALLSPPPHLLHAVYSLWTLPNSSSSYTSTQEPGITRTQDCHKTNDRLWASPALWFFCLFFVRLCSYQNIHTSIFFFSLQKFQSLPSKFQMIPWDLFQTSISPSVSSPSINVDVICNCSGKVLLEVCFVPQRSLPVTQQTVAKGTIPHDQSSGWHIHREQALCITSSQPQPANALTTMVTNRVRSFPFLA